MKHKAKHATHWIDVLPYMPQAEFGRRCELGSHDEGFCCLGAGCFLLGDDYQPSDQLSKSFQESVGLIYDCGMFRSGCEDELLIYYGKYSLASVNDETGAGFKRIANLLKTRPDWMFKGEVAKGIKEHYLLQESELLRGLRVVKYLAENSPDRLVQGYGSCKNISYFTGLSNESVIEMLSEEGEWPIGGISEYIDRMHTKSFWTNNESRQARIKFMQSHTEKLEEKLFR